MWLSPRRPVPCAPCLPGTLEPHWSGLLWTAMLVSLAIVVALPKPHGVRALIASTILRLIFSVGLQPTLFLLGAFNVSTSPSHLLARDMQMALPSCPGPRRGPALSVQKNTVPFGSAGKVAEARQPLPFPAPASVGRRS